MGKWIVIIASSFLTSCFTESNSGGFAESSDLDFKLSPVLAENYPDELDSIVDNILRQKGVVGEIKTKVFFSPIIENVGQETQLEKIDSTTYDVEAETDNQKWFLSFTKKYILISCDRID